MWPCTFRLCSCCPCRRLHLQPAETAAQGPPGPAAATQTRVSTPPRVGEGGRGSRGPQEAQSDGAGESRPSRTSLLAGRHLALLAGQRVPHSGKALPPQLFFFFFIMAASQVSTGACSREGLLKKAEFSSSGWGSINQLQPPPRSQHLEGLLSPCLRKLDKGMACRQARQTLQQLSGCGMASWHI